MDIDTHHYSVLLFFAIQYSLEELVIMGDKKWILGLLCLVNFTSNAAMMNFDTDKHIRFSAGFGPRYINQDMISNTKWDTAAELGLSVYKNIKSKNLYAGVQTLANTAWDARFNSVNNPSDTTTSTLQVHNSSALDLIAFVGKEFSPVISGEIGVGAQLSWVKWLSSPQQASDRTKVLPKIRVSLNHKLTNTAQLFVAYNQSFNTYDALSCTSGAANCFNDEGFVSVSDLKIGVNFQLS